MCDEFIFISFTDPYLEKFRFFARTDQDSLCWIQNLSEASQPIGRWRLRWIELDFIVVYRAVVKCQTADVLSRLPKNENGMTPQEVVLSKMFMETVDSAWQDYLSFKLKINSNNLIP